MLLHVMVVDDDAINRFILKRMLEKLSFRVTEADSGAEALKIMHSDPVDMVFMDISMPYMDGYEAARRMREESDLGALLPIIAATAHNTLEARSLAYVAGMSDFLTKPFRAQAVAAVAARWDPTKLYLADNDRTHAARVQRRQEDQPQRT